MLHLLNVELLIAHFACWQQIVILKCTVKPALSEASHGNIMTVHNWLFHQNILLVLCSVTEGGDKSSVLQGKIDQMHCNGCRNAGKSP